MARPRKQVPVLHPDQAPFITDEHMPAAAAGAADAAGRPEEPAARHVYVLVAATGPGRTAPVAAFKTPAAAQAAAELHAGGADVEAVRLYGSAEQWQAGQ